MCTRVLHDHVWLRRTLRQFLSIQSRNDFSVYTRSIDHPFVAILVDGAIRKQVVLPPAAICQEDLHLHAQEHLIGPVAMAFSPTLESYLRTLNTGMQVTGRDTQATCMLRHYPFRYTLGMSARLLAAIVTPLEGRTPIQQRILVYSRAASLLMILILSKTWRLR